MITLLSFILDKNCWYFGCGHWILHMWGYCGWY